MSEPQNSDPGIGAADANVSGAINASSKPENRVRWGITIPFDEVPLYDHDRWFRRLEELGYSDVWTGEANAADGFTPLALAARAAPTLTLGTAVVPVYTRGPGLLAVQAATMAEVAPGRFHLGIGSSSDVIVENWNAMAFDRPYQRVRDTVRFLRRALTGEKVDMELETFAVKGFRLLRPIEQAPPIHVAALRPGMLRLAGREADGAVVNWLGADDVTRVVGEVGPGREIVARIFVCPTDDAQQARAIGRSAIAAYLNVEVYAQFHRWLGRGPLLEAMWHTWAAGDRKGSLKAIPDEVVDALVVHGSPEECRAHIGRYVANGVTVPVIALLPGYEDLGKAVESLAPSS